MMQIFLDEAKELLRPSARCFKGFSILLTIWGIASLLICGIVPTIILVHNPLTGAPSSAYGELPTGEYNDPLVMTAASNR